METRRNTKQLTFDISKNNESSRPFLAKLVEDLLWTQVRKKAIVE